MNDNFILICFYTWFAFNVQGIDIGFNEEIFIPNNAYLQIQKTVVPIIDEDYNPGKVNANIMFTYQSSQKNNSNQTSNITFDIYRFKNSSIPAYICYIKSIQNGFYQANCPEFYQTCSSEGTCQNISECLIYPDKSNISCCTGCLLSNTIKTLNFTYLASSQITDVQQDQDIYIIDNTNFQNSSGSYQGGPIAFDCNYQVIIQPEDTYFRWTLIVIISSSLLIIILSVGFIILFCRYRKAKGKTQKEMLTGDQSLKKFSSKASNQNKSKDQ